MRLIDTATSPWVAGLTPDVQPDIGKKTKTPITINGKFLQGELVRCGVHRTALNFSAQLLRHAQSVTPARILTPGVTDWAVVAASGLLPEVHRSRLGGGQAWEMLALPAQTRGELLINFCNLGPILHRNSVVMIHDVQTITQASSYSWRQVLGYRMLWRQIARNARAVLTVSEDSRQSLVEHGFAAEEKIFVVPNGTDHILRIEADPFIVERLGLAGRRFALVMGSLQPHKNIETLFRAYRDPRLSDTSLVIMGSSGRAAYEALGWKPPRNTVFTGGVSDAELRALYTAATLFLFPSLTEGFGLPPVEAMQCGTAALVSDGGAVPEVSGPGGLIVPARDAEAWADAVWRNLENDTARAELEARGRERAGQLTWDQAGATLWRHLYAML